MMNEASRYPLSGSASCSEAMEEALSLYMDGELACDVQPVLFAHLASCGHCRRTLDAMMKFRRISRQERLPVPPGVDDAFLKRLARHKHANRRVDRAADRRPLWQARAPISLRGAVVVALTVFITGLLLPVKGTPHVKLPYVEGQDERVEFLEPAASRQEAVYVFYPGLTVEAYKVEELPGFEPL